jgi:hypothetical protein
MKEMSATFESSRAGLGCAGLINGSSRVAGSVGRLPNWWCLVSARATIVKLCLGIWMRWRVLVRPAFPFPDRPGVIRQSGQSATKRLCDLHDPPANAADGLIDYGFKGSTNGTVAVIVLDVWFGVYESYGMIAVRV